MTPTRGERNCNPGNIEKRLDVFWMGQAPASLQTDSRFVVFMPSGPFPDNAKYGLRAIAKTLLTYYTRHGINTVRGIIGRWAPLRENNTDAYIDNVCTACGVGADTPLNVQNRLTLAGLVRAIVMHENGRVQYSDAGIIAGVELALQVVH